MQSTGRLTVELKRLMRDSYDRCSGCGRKLPDGVPAYAGYAKDGGPIYAGPCCEASIGELGTHVYWWWKIYKRPEPSAPIWRFMDFAKFVTLLKDRALYFSRADYLGDPFEGARGVATRKPEWDEPCLEYFRQAITNPPPGMTCELSNEEIEREASRLLRDFEALGERELRRMYVSCWHENEAESEALWRLYCPPPSAGIAIHSDCSSLNLSLGNNPEIEVGRVQYIDFRKQFSGTYDRIFWKRKSLNHEAEVRAVIQRVQPSDEAGILVPVDLSKLIKAVVVSPFAPTWFRPALEEVLTKFELRAPVIASDLTAKPFF
jgi:hypothetical protein